MTRTKWLRLVVRNPADVLRWAGQQNARRLDEFRYRTIAGREFVSFRLVPRYSIEIGTSDIIVVAHASGGVAHRLVAALSAVGRRTVGRMTAIASRLSRRCPSEPARSAELHHFPAARLSSPLHG